MTTEKTEIGLTGDLAVKILDLLEAKHLHGFDLSKTHRDSESYAHYFLNKNRYKTQIGRSRSRTAPKLARLVDHVDRQFKSLITQIGSYHQQHKATGKSTSVSASKAKSLENLLRSLIKEAYARSYRLGVESSGISQTARGLHIDVLEKKWVSSAVTSEMKFLNGLINDVRAGKNISLGRVSMYSKALRSIYDAGRVATLHPDVIIHWRIDKKKENCKQCEEISNRGPYTRDTLPFTPKSGQTQCLGNCACSLSFEFADDNERADEIRGRLPSKKTLIRNIRKF